MTEEDASKFLYWFGVKTSSYDPNHPEQQFQSVIYGYSLAEVMDTVVRGSVQARLAEQFGSFKLEEAIGKKTEIIAKVFLSVRDEFKAKGITITNIGFSSGLNFERSVQDAINANFAATMKAKELTALAPVIPVMQQQTNQNMQLTLANKWNGALPNPSGLMILPGGFLDKISNWFTSSSAKNQ